MNTTQNIAKNIGVIGFSNVIISLLGFFLLTYTARYLGEVEYGKYSFAMSFTSIFITLTTFGMNNLIIREIARSKERTNEYLTNVLVIRLPLSLLAFVLIVLSMNIMKYPRDTAYTVYLFGIFNILTSLEMTFRSIFQAYEKMEYDAIVGIIEKIILLLVVLLAIYRGYDLIKLAYVYVFVSMISVTLSIAVLFIKITKLRPIFDLSLWKPLLIGSIPFGLNALFGILFFQISTVMLSVFKNDAAVGIYSAAYNPLLALSIVPTIFITAIYPAMSRLFISSKGSLETLTKLSSNCMVIFGFPTAIGCFILADRFIKLFYADQFSASIASFQILAFFIPLRWVSSITGTFLTSTNKQGLRTLCVGISAFVNVILNVAMIPKLGYIGSSIATVLSEIFLYFMFIYFIDSYYKKLNFHKYFIRPLIASLTMGGFILCFHSINLFLLVASAGIVYFTVLLLLKPFSKEDIEIFKQVIKID